MNEKDAGQVAKIQAIAWVILVSGLTFALICFGISLIRWW